MEYVIFCFLHLLRLFPLRKILTGMGGKEYRYKTLFLIIHCKYQCFVDYNHMHYEIYMTFLSLFTSQCVVNLCSCA